MSIRFINTTTILPVDNKIETIFLETICPLYREAVDSTQHQANVDIFFVNDIELDVERKRVALENETPLPEDETSMDLLGIYFSFHPEFNRPVIKVSPEKVMAACVSFKSSTTTTLGLARLYPSLLSAVVIHELAHWIMDNSSNNNHKSIPWTWLVDRLEEDPQYNFCGSHHISTGHNRHHIWRQIRHFIEESLANAFVLKQKVKSDELDFLKEFIVAQPSGYKQGGLWSGNLGTLLKVANTWGRFKQDGDHQRWNFVFDEGYTPAQKLIDRLRSGESIRSVDFVRDFYQHLANRAGAWQSLYLNDKQKWNEHLNGTFGVLSTITRWGGFHGVRSSHRLKFLKQWAANGSPDAVDELHKSLAYSAKAQGKYKEALRHQRDRLHHLPNLKQNDYWHKKNEEEIKASITELEALISQ